MKKKECAADKHDWVERFRVKGMRCKECGAHFPCDKKTCGHLDCLDWRLENDIEVLCHKCSAPIKKIVKDPNVVVSVNDKVQMAVKMQHSDKETHFLCGKCK
jgi:hypothetical protein